jgi:hypothetical protein
MAKVWFVRPQNRLVTLGNRPVYERPLEPLFWALDLGLHRYYTAGPLSYEGDVLPTEFAAGDLVLVEVTPADITAGTNYQVGFYSSPYSPKAAMERLGAVVPIPSPS